MWKLNFKAFVTFEIHVSINYPRTGHLYIPIYNTI